MNVLTAEQMREADRRTIAAGTPGEVLMERAGTRVVEVLEREFAPLGVAAVVIFCGKGNNGGDGLVVARLLERRVAALQVVRVGSRRSRLMTATRRSSSTRCLAPGFAANVEGPLRRS